MRGGGNRHARMDGELTYSAPHCGVRLEPISHNLQSAICNPHTQEPAGLAASPPHTLVRSRGRPVHGAQRNRRVLCDALVGRGRWDWEHGKGISHPHPRIQRANRMVHPRMAIRLLLLLLQLANSTQMPRPCPCPCPCPRPRRGGSPVEHRGAVRIVHPRPPARLSSVQFSSAPSSWPAGDHRENIMCAQTAGGWQR